MSSDTKKILSFLLKYKIVDTIEDATIKADYVIIHKNQTLKDIALNLIEELDEVDMLEKESLDYKSVVSDIKDDGIYYEMDGDVYEYLG